MLADSPSSPPPLFEARALSKSYGAVQALSQVDFHLAPGEVHALVGENGAGKSTLARLICGLMPPDSGTMLLRGRPYAPHRQSAAEHAGVRMMMQELTLIPTLTVAESIFTGQMPSRFGIINYRRLNRAAADLLEELGLNDISPGAKIASLGVGQQQMVEVARALSRPCDLLILDEPTAALTDRECELLFAHIHRLRQRGAGIIYISHRMEEIKRIADRITVLRDGRNIATRSAADIPIDEVIRLMVGREIGQAHRAVSGRGAVALRVERLCRGQQVRDVSFAAHHGEILGFAGLMGSGRTETMRAIFGADRADSGQIFLRGSNAPARIRSPRDAVRSGIALLTEDRKAQGLLLPLSISANTTLTSLPRISRLGCIGRSAERSAARDLAEAMSLRYHSLDQSVGQLSGGNQQKVVIAKWLFRDCDILIFDEPTRGIDVGAKFEIYRLLNELAQGGKSIIVVSSDLVELMAICDRIAVMSVGRVAATFERGRWTQDAIMAAALSGHLTAASARSDEAGSV